MEKYYANFAVDYGENAANVQRCMFSEESRFANVNEMWIDNWW